MFSPSLPILAALALSTAAPAQPPEPAAAPWQGSAARPAGSAAAADSLGPVGCADSLRDAAGGACLEASSIPELGSLYPMTELFNISHTPLAKVLINKSFVEYDDTVLEVNGLAQTQTLHVTQPNAFDLAILLGAHNNPLGVMGIRALPNSLRFVLEGEEQIFMRQNNLGIGGVPFANLHVQDTGSVTLNLQADTDNVNEDDQPGIIMSQDGGIVRTRIGMFGGSNHLQVAQDYGFADLHLSVADVTQDGSSRSIEFHNTFNAISVDVEARLTGNGDWHIDGSLVSPGADVAEYYPTVPGLEAGDVVSFSGNGLELTAATLENASRLAGVISSRPGLVLGTSNTQEEPGMTPPPALDDEARLLGQGELRVDQHVRHELEINQRGPLALAGRVPVKVTDEGGPIAVGDRLTVASLPGHARRARAGEPVLGMALGEWLGGQGRIPMIVTSASERAHASARSASGRARLGGTGRAWIELPEGLSRTPDGSDLAIQLTPVGTFEPFALGRIQSDGFEVLAPVNVGAFHWRAERMD